MFRSRRFRRNFRRFNTNRIARRIQNRTVRRYVLIGKDTADAVGAGVIDVHSLVTVNNAPDNSVISNGTTIAELEEESYVNRIKLQLFINGTATGDANEPIDVILYRDYKGQVGNITDPADIFDGPNTEANDELRRHAIWFKRLYLTAAKDRQQFFINTTMKGKGYLPQGSVIKLAIMNKSASESIQTSVIGHIYAKTP